MFPRRSDEVSIHSISSSSSWIGRWLSRDISRDNNKALIFYLSALRGKSIQAWQGYTIVYKSMVTGCMCTIYVRYLSLIMISIEVSYTVGIYVYIPVYLRHLVSMAICMLADK